jgi:Domain of unknown function (DUF4390)
VTRRGWFRTTVPRRARSATFIAGVLGVALASAASISLAGANRDQAIEVSPLTQDGLVLVSFTTARVVSHDIERAINSGLPTTLTYDVELRRSSMFWFDQLIGSARIAATVRYDALTRRYHVSLTHDGRVAEARSTADARTVKRWISDFHRLPLFSARRLRAGTDYYVRVRGRTRPRNTWSFWPWYDPSATGIARLTLQR